MLRKAIASLTTPRKKKSTSDPDASTADSKAEDVVPVEFVTHLILETHKFRLPAYFKPIKAIGRGASGVVISARDARNGDLVAIKRVAGAFCERHAAKRFLREIMLLSFLNHPNVMSLRELPTPATEAEYEDVYMVVEKMDADLHVVLQTQKLSPDHQTYFMYQLVCALYYLHSAGIVHRDLKPANLLIDAACQLKVCDFGLSRAAGMTDAVMTEYVVTRHYRAPEIMLACKKYSAAIDMWSAGCILAEILLPGEVLFRGRDYLEMLQGIFHFLGKPNTEAGLAFITSKRARAYVNGLPNSPGVDLSEHFLDASPQALDLLRRLLTLDPAHRITAEEALQHPYFAACFEQEDLEPAPATFLCPYDDRDDLSSDDIRRLMYRMAGGAGPSSSAPAATATAAVAAAAETVDSSSASAGGKPAVAASAPAVAATTAAAAPAPAPQAQ